MSEPLLALHGIKKTFSGVTVLHGVDFSVRAGEVMALVGENGAGKSTLMKIVSGIYPADPGGGIRLAGRAVHFSDVRQSTAAGIAIIHQDLNLLPGMTVAENLFLAREPLNGLGMIDWPRLRARCRELLSALHQDIDPDAMVGRLSVGQQQMVEIARALSLDAQVVIMDEPTDALTDVETDILFDAVRHLRENGKGIIYISHRLDEIFRLCDSVTVLRDGHMVFTGPVAAIDEQALIHHMVGREIVEKYPYVQESGGALRLRVEHLTAPGITDISFEVRAGEVVGFAGLMGAGRTELGKALYGASRIAAGSVRIDGQPVMPKSPREAVQAGIAYLPEDRRTDGLIQTQSVRTNMSLAALRRFSDWLGLIARSREQEAVTRFFDSFAIKGPGPEAAIANLSGGNQQKVLLAKALMTEPRVIIFDEPTRGVDVGARRELYASINQLKSKGLAILLMSSDMQELLGIADRIMVLSRGHLTGSFEHGRATQEAIMKQAVA